MGGEGVGGNGRGGEVMGSDGIGWDGVGREGMEERRGCNRMGSDRECGGAPRMKPVTARRRTVRVKYCVEGSTCTGMYMY